MTTLTLQTAMFQRLQAMGVYSCLEVKMPDSDERVDMLTYRKRNKTWEMYEFKVSKSDLCSKAAMTFRGNRNFLCVPAELVEEALKVARNQYGVGVYSVTDYGDIAIANIVKKSIKREIDIPHNDLMFSMMQALAGKYQRSNLYKGENFLDARVVNLKEEIRDLKDRIKNYESMRVDFLEEHGWREVE